MDTTAPATAPALALAPVVALPAPAVLPLWQIQLIHAAAMWAEETEHTCPAPARGNAAAALTDDGCDACYWQALYDQVPARLRRAVISDIAAGFPTLPDGVHRRA